MGQTVSSNNLNKNQVSKWETLSDQMLDSDKYLARENAREKIEKLEKKMSEEKGRIADAKKEKYREADDRERMRRKIIRKYRIFIQKKRYASAKRMVAMWKKMEAKHMKSFKNAKVSRSMKKRRTQSTTMNNLNKLLLRRRNNYNN